jgi:hypothetical protein
MLALTVAESQGKRGCGATPVNCLCGDRMADTPTVHRFKARASTLRRADAHRSG